MLVIDVPLLEEHDDAVDELTEHGPREQQRPERRSEGDPHTGFLGRIIVPDTEQPERRLVLGPDQFGQDSGHDKRDGNIERGEHTAIQDERGHPCYLQSVRVEASAERKLEHGCHKDYIYSYFLEKSIKI